MLNFSFDSPVALAPSSRETNLLLVGEQLFHGRTELQLAAFSGDCVISSAFAAELIALLPTETNAMVMSTLGISWNTWMKIRSGRAIRVSTGQRLIDRVSRYHQTVCHALEAPSLPDVAVGWRDRARSW